MNLWLGKSNIFASILLLAFLMSFQNHSAVGKDFDIEKPNIILILVDDMGWNGISSYGNTHVRTPNIDRLADQGMKFTQAYVSPECTPTRGELLSGEYSARTGLTQVHHRRIYPNAPMVTPKVSGKLAPDTYTIANLLKDAGYNTAISGKWHVGDGGRVANIKERFGSEYFKPYGFEVIGDAAEREWLENYSDYNDKNKEKANLAIIEDVLPVIEQAEDYPFFAYLSFFSPHTPIIAPDSITTRYTDRGFPKANALFGDATEKPTADYVAMIRFLDQSIGKLLNILDEKGLTQETMIVFMSDNGGLNRAWDNYPLRGAKGLLYEGGIRVPLIVKWPSYIPAGTTNATPVHIVDIFPTFKAISGGEIPNGKMVDGLNLLPLLRSQGEIDREAIYWHHPHYIHDYGKTPSSAIRVGDYKLIYYYHDYIDPTGYLPMRGKPFGKLKVGERLELFNIEKDPFEQVDLSKELPLKTERLFEKLKAGLADMEAPMPQINPKDNLSLWHEYSMRN